MAGGGTSSNTPTEDPNDLISYQRIKILDLNCEGPISGFALNSGTYGNDPLTSTFFDEVPVRNLDGSYNFNVSGQGFVFSTTLGTSGQTSISGFGNTENLLALAGSTRVSNPPNGGGDYKYFSASFNTITYPDATSIRIALKVPALYTQDSDGNTKGYTISYKVSISVNNGPFVSKITRSINGKCTSPYVIDHYLPLPKGTTLQSYYEWKIRIERTSQNILSTRVQNELYVDSITVISNSKFSYPNSALTAITMSAQQFSQIPTRAYKISGTLVKVPKGYVPTTYNTNGTITAATYPSIWDGTFDTSKRWTDNPAWILYDLLTNKRYGLGRYLQEELVDKWTLYEIAQYCDQLVDDGNGGLEPRFTCNLVIGSRVEAFQLIQNLVSVFRGITYWENGKIMTTYNSDKSPVYNFTNANVVDGAFTYSNTAKNTRSTVAKVKWMDPKNLYKENIEIVEDIEGILKYGYIEKEVSAFGCTSKGQALRLGNWILNTEKLLTETVSFQTTLEGAYVKPGEMFNVYDNFRNNRSQGGRLLGFSSGRSGVELDRPVILESGYTYSLSVFSAIANLQASGEITGSSQFTGIRVPQIENKIVTNIANSSISSLSLNGALSSNVPAGATWILSVTGNPSASMSYLASPYRCLASTEIEAGKIEILGVEYNSGINVSVEKNYTISTSPVISGDTTVPPAPSFVVLIPSTGLYIDNFLYSYFEIDWGNVPSGDHYVVSGRRFGDTWKFLGETTSTAFTFGGISSTGLHEAAVAAVSPYGIESPYTTGSYTIGSTNPLSVLPQISGIVITANQDYVLSDSINQITTGYKTQYPTFSWVYPRDSNGVSSSSLQFLTGVRYSFRDELGNLLYGPFNFSDVNNLSYTVTDSDVTGMGYRRMFQFRLETLDAFGGIGTGYRITVNNPPPRPPLYSGFNAMLGGVQYSLRPSAFDSDISGVFLWVSPSAFTPNFSNFTYFGTSLNGYATNNVTGNYNVWFSIVDTYGTGNSTIYGPVSVTSSYGVTGISANNVMPAAQGLINLSGTSGISISSVGNGGNFTFSTNVLTSGGGLAVSYSNSSVILSGRSSVTIPMFLQTPLTGVGVYEVYFPNSFTYTGHVISSRGPGSGVSGYFYTDNLTNSNLVKLDSFNLVSTTVSLSSPFNSVPFTGNRKIGVSITGLYGNYTNLSFSVLGYGLSV